MTTSPASQPVPVELKPMSGQGVVAARSPTAPLHAAGRPVPAVAVLIVTWNRKDLLTRVLEAVASQSLSGCSLHVVVVDNASTDSTAEHLAARFQIDRMVDNRATAADDPRFTVVPPIAPPTHARPRSAFASFTLVQNRLNFGGCGGFNTAFACTEQLLADLGIDYAWLVDDDADLPPDALDRLLGAMRTDDRIGLVGSRTVDANQRDTTIESTIYFDASRGMMSPTPPARHPQHQNYQQWIARVGDRVGRRPFTGALDVDVVSACSMLARWSAVIGTLNRPGVGFWDRRFFIYCDDADWCLRFARAGWRVVLSLDAVVFHTPWLLKLTPQRVYYAQRNAIWMMNKALDGAQLRRVTRTWMRNLLGDARRAMSHRRLFHARIILATIRDAIGQRSGDAAPGGPPTQPVRDALDRLRRSFSQPVRVAICISDEHTLACARRLMTHAAGLGVQWIAVVRNTVPGFAEGFSPDRLLEPSQPEPSRSPESTAQPIHGLVYAPRMFSRLKKQLAIARLRPQAVVVFDQTNDFPVVLSHGFNIHIDSKAIEAAQVERESLLDRLILACIFLTTSLLAVTHCLTVSRDRRQTKYG